MNQLQRTEKANQNILRKTTKIVAKKLPDKEPKNSPPIFFTQKSVTKITRFAKVSQIGM